MVSYLIMIACSQKRERERERPRPRPVGSEQPIPGRQRQPDSISSEAIKPRDKLDSGVDYGRGVTMIDNRSN